jgi:hypothetical protein
MKEIMDQVALAKANPGKKYLFIQVHAGHGYHFGGFQEFLSNFLDYETKSPY